MHKIMLSDELKIEFTYYSLENQNPTLIFVPGLGTRGGRTKKYAQNYQQRLSKEGIEVNLVTFLYKSHQGDTITGFGNDPKDLSNVIDTLEENGIKKNTIGLVGLCYGSYVVSKYLRDYQEINFAVMIEPFLGIRSLKIPLKVASFAAKYVSDTIKFPDMPIGKRYNENMGFFDVKDFLDNDEDIRTLLGRNKVPISILILKKHRFLDTKYAFSLAYDINSKLFIVGSEKNNESGIIKGVNDIKTQLRSFNLGI